MIPEVNPVPVITTLVPPVVGPILGTILLIVKLEVEIGGGVVIVPLLNVIIWPVTAFHIPERLLTISIEDTARVVWIVTLGPES